jgi:serine/threonine protein kinase/predicted Zn-dependent protease
MVRKTSMNQERWQRLKEIVADALEEDSPAARTALLNRECADDLSLLREAESFLANADTVAAEGMDRLEECAAAASAVVRRDKILTPGRRIGAYVIIRELGRGGMAAVYLAARADGYFEKEVAIKVLKPAEGTASELLGRFRAEREVLASLDHPNIAGLFDAGTTEEGMPYFVMEYVSGTPITNFVRDRHLSVRQRLALFLKICSAVEAAHRKRVVHRDLKRSNILVNEDGEPKLLDFGIAKLLQEDPAALTATGQQRLTPISASPEQARGEAVTTASDIYALGALLYEMLTGHTPHRFSSRQPGLNEVERVICEEEPIIPSAVADDPALQRALRGDLDAIILRALRKDPARRYSSVGELEADIRHYLAREPVQARANTLPYRLLRFAGRHQPSPLRLLLGVLVLASVVALSLYLARHYAKPVAARPPPKPPPAVISPRSIAVLPFDDFAAADGSSYFADGVQDDILTDLAKAQDLKVISRSGAAAYREGVRDVRAIRQNLGVAYVLEGSVRRQDDRVRVNVQLIDTDSDVQVWAEQYERKLDDLFALQSELSQAIVGQLKGKLSAREKAAMGVRPTQDMEAYDRYLQAKAALTQYDYVKAIKLLKEAIGRDPKFALAYCVLTDAHLFAYRFGGDPSKSHLEEAETAAETALQLMPNLPEAHLAKAQYYYNGLRDYEKTLAELAIAPPSPDARARFFDLTALAERRLGRWKEALRDGEKALELDPRDPFISTEVIQTYLALHRYRDAEELAGKAIQLIPMQRSPFWMLKADAILAQGEPERARAALQAAPPEVEDLHLELARTAMYAGDLSAALEEVTKARTPNSRAPMPDLMEGTIAHLQGNTERSQAAFERARIELERQVQEQPENPWPVSYLAWVYAGLGRKDDALKASAQSLRLIPSWRDSMEGPEYANMQAQIQAWLGEKTSALNYLKTASGRPGSPSYGELKFDVGWANLRDEPGFAEILASAAKPIKLD